MLTEEIRSHVSDVLAIEGLSSGRTLELIRRRVKDINLEQLLVAAIAELREQARYIAELETEIDAINTYRDCLEGDVSELKTKIKLLRAKLTQSSPVLP